MTKVCKHCGGEFDNVLMRGDICIYCKVYFLDKEGKPKCV